MKSILVIGAFIVAAVVTAVPAAVLQAQGDKALEETAAARSKAMSSGDAAGWGKYTTEDFIVVGPDGSMRTKAERLAEIKAKPTAASGLTDVKVRKYGPGTAVSIGQGTVDGKPTRITTVWVQQEGVWKAASVQLTTITSK
jgi:hypothetical protein